MSLSGRRILFEGSVQPWDVGWTFIQMFAVALAQENDVAYVDTPLSAARIRLPTIRRLRPYGERKLHGRLTLYRSATFPAQRTPRARWAAARITARGVARWVRKTGFEPDLLWIFSPEGLSLAEAFPSTRMVYWTGDHAELLPGEEELYRRADAVLCVARPVEQRLREAYGDKVHFSPVAVDFDRFDEARRSGAVDAQVAGLRHPIAGYAGSVNRRLDIPLLVELARALDGTVVLAGPEQLTRAQRAALDAEPNVVLLGPQTAERLGALMLGFDVALIPYVADEFNFNCNPVKFYEYLALGLPVAATHIPTLTEFEGPASIGSRETFVERALAMTGRRENDIDARVAIARAHSFNALLDRLDGIL